MSKKFRIYITTKELAQETGHSESFYEKLRCYGEGPAYYKIGGSVRYKLSEVEAWIESCRSASREL